MLRKTLLISAVAIGIVAGATSAAQAGVKPVPAAKAASAASLPLNVRAQLAATRIVNADESAASVAIGRPMTATAARPLAGQYDSSLVGTTITASGLQVTVAGRPSAALTTAIAAQAQGVPVAIRVVAHSKAQLTSVQSRITADLKYWSARGIHIAAWGPDVTTDKVSVSLTRYSARAAQAIVARYGADWVTVATGSVAAQPSYSRTSDSPPWFGGDEVYHVYKTSGSTVYFSICTTGFSLKIGSSYYVPVDDHCADSNFSNDFYNPDGTAIGYIYGDDSFHDELLIHASSVGGYIWSDPTSADRTVTGVASTDPVGGLICTDGYTNREVCSVKIESTNQNVTYTINGLSTTVKNTVYACQTGGKAAFSSGDSGGPVETTIGSSATTARGAILAYTGNASCGWYMPERTIESDWGASVVIG